MGEWKPGDVAMVNNGYDARPGIMIGDDPAARCWHSAEDNGDMRCVDHDRAALRRLVVIDPEDREQVERLAAAYISANISVATAPEMIARRLTNALREFADPKPPCGASLTLGKDGALYRCSEAADHKGPHADGTCVWMAES